MSAEVAIGGRLATYRAYMGLSQAELSARIRSHDVNWPQGTLSRVELGERPVRLSEALAISKVLRVSLESLAGTGALCSWCDDKPPHGYVCVRCGVTG